MSNRNEILGQFMGVVVTVPTESLLVISDAARKLSDPDATKRAVWEKRISDCLREQSLDSTQSTPEFLLELLGTVHIAKTTGQFIAKAKFVRDTGRKAKVKISYLGDNFKAWFLSGDGKTEDPISAQTLRYHKLRRASVDGPIIAELGGEEKSATTLTEMFSLMKKQKNGESGALLNNGSANIFYIKDSAGVLRTVYVCWIVDGWSVDADYVAYPRRWDDGRQVFSRNSVL